MEVSKIMCCLLPQGSWHSLFHCFDLILSRYEDYFRIAVMSKLDYGDVEKEIGEGLEIFS